MNIVTLDNEFQGNELTIIHLRVQTTCSNVHFNTRWKISRKSSQYFAGNFKPISRSEDRRLQCRFSSIRELVLLIPCSPEGYVRRDTHVSFCLVFRFNVTLQFPVHSPAWVVTRTHAKWRDLAKMFVLPVQEIHRFDFRSKKSSA